MEDMEDMRRSFKTASIIGVVVIVSLIFYLILVEVLRSQMHSFRGFVTLPEISTFRYIFYGLAVAEVVIIRLVQGLLLKRTPGDNARTSVHKLMRTTVITVCLSEVPALLGLALFFIGGFIKDFYALLAVSLVLVFMYFPRLSSWENWIRRNN